MDADRDAVRAGAKLLLLDWVRLADQAGFDTLSSLDRPNYDMWDPLASLAVPATAWVRSSAAEPKPSTNSILALQDFDLERSS